MDQGGLKRNGNRDDSLTFLEPEVGVGRESVGDTADSLLHANMHLPNNSPAPLQMVQSTVASNGQVAPKSQGNMRNIFESPDICFNMGDNLSVVNHGSSGLDRSSTNIINTSDVSVLRDLPIPDLFGSHIKQEQDFSLPKDLEDFNTHPGSCDLDSDVRLLEDSEIWQDLDLPGTLPEINHFELDSEVAHLDNILQDSSVGEPLQGMLKEAKSLVSNGGHYSAMNGIDPYHGSMHHQPSTLLSSVMIKEEKDDDFIHIQTPGVVKQEKQDNASYCASQCLQSSPLHGNTMASIGYQYRPATSPSVNLPDQKPFAMYPTLPPVEEGWARGRYGDGSAMQRSTNGLASPSTLAPYPLNFSR
ncbi:unnamed protein product [Knipowitschia caucasica]